MANVKSSDSKRQIAQPTSNKPPQKSGGPAVVKAVKNGIQRSFSRQTWDNLPSDKEGYSEVVETPEIPAPAPQEQKPADQKPAEPAEPSKQSPTYDEAVKAYTDAYGEAPGQDLTIEEILAKVTAKKQEGK